MRYVDEFRDSRLARDLLDCIAREADRPMRFMEVCGTHTMAIARYGIRDALPETVRLISGPGCPVCVTPQSQIDTFIAMGGLPDVTLATFGDMVRVPGTDSTLETQRACGADVRIVYSPLDAVALAADQPGRKVVFFGVGFETTAPAVALSVLEAARLSLTNYWVLCAHKVIPPALSAIASDPEVCIDGFICPGHVSAITGTAAYEPIVRNFGVPCVIAGFEPLDVLQSVLMLLRQVRQRMAEVEVQYSRVVSVEGNLCARACTERVFEPSDAEWRGLGVIPGSGLKLQPAYSRFDACHIADGLALPALSYPTITCECALILRGRKEPWDCRAFGGDCTPEHPLGPCMVSSEGACAAAYRYST